MKLQHIYLYRNKYLFVPNAKTDRGITVGYQPVITLSVGSTPEEVYKAFMECFVSSSQIIPHPQRWGELLEPLLKASGVKSYKTFAESAKMISASFKDDTIEVHPLKNLGIKQGFGAQPEKKIQINLKQTSSQEVGMQLIESFNLCL